MTYTIRDNNGNVVFSVENVNQEISIESITSKFGVDKFNKLIEVLNKFEKNADKTLQNIFKLPKENDFSYYGFGLCGSNKYNAKKIAKSILKNKTIIISCAIDFKTNATNNDASRIWYNEYSKILTNTSSFSIPGLNISKITNDDYFIDDYEKPKLFSGFVNFEAVVNI